MLSCEQFRELAWVVLEGESHPEAYAHLDSCPRCRRLIHDLGAIAHAAHNLPDQTPSPQLWSRLESAALEEGLWRRSGWSWLSQGWEALLPVPARPALAGLLVVVLAVVLAGVGEPVMEFPAEERTPAIAFAVAQGELVHAAGYGARYQTHLNQMESELLEEAALVNSALPGLAARPLHTLDRAIGQTQLRLAEYPDDSLAREELLRLYRQKATVLQAMSDLTWQDVSY